MKNIHTALICMIILTGLAFAGEESERKLVRQVDPEYPEIAKKMAVHSTIKLKLWIDPSGSVSRVEYITGHPMLSFAAITAAKKWQYAAGDKESTATIELKF